MADNGFMMIFTKELVNFSIVCVSIEECTELALQEERLLAEKKNLISDIGGDREKLQELEKLMQFTGKGQMMELLMMRHLTVLPRK